MRIAVFHLGYTNAQRNLKAVIPVAKYMMAQMLPYFFCNFFGVVEFGMGQ